MVIDFSKEEQKYLEIIKGNWSVKEDCPQNIKKALRTKINLIMQADFGSYQK